MGFCPPRHPPYVHVCMAALIGGRGNQKGGITMEQTSYKPVDIDEMEDVKMQEYVIRTKQVSKKFKNTYAMKDLSMSVRKNTVYGL